MRAGIILCMAGLALAALLITPALAPLYALNLSRSVPVGLYRLESQNLHRGDLAVIHLSPPWRDLAASRGYLPHKALLIKPVAALSGDHVCRLGQRITINGQLVAIAQPADQKGRVLPVWEGCVTLLEGELFVLSASDDSFDGRYFGITPRSAVIAKAKPVSWLLPK